ncbi:MAG: hypothetical protein U9N85_13200 [Bacteroidota bacterium]|nr:hypothetical protein [Bacteroidota bacterium]
MNKRWWITIAIIIVALIVIGVLYDRGYLQTEWTGLSMIFAALAGPYMALKNGLLKSKKEEELLKKYEVLKKEEKEHRTKTDAEIVEREERIKHLDEKITASEDEIEKIQQRKESVEEEIEDLSIGELQDEAINYFGD